MQPYYNLVGRAESGGNDNASNPRSSASGRFQFINSTYLPYARQIMPGVSDNELLAKKNDPNVQQQVMERFTADNTNTLKNAGLDPSNRNLYLAHFAGPQGAVNVLKADPNAKVSDILGPQVVQANPFLANYTANDLLNWSDRKMAGNADTANTQPQPPQQAQNTEYRDSVLQGGPMAMFGMGQQGYDWGNALTGLGASIASISSPSQAAAIAGLRNDPGKDIVSQYDSQTGTWSHYNKKTGAYTQTKDPNWLKNMTDAYSAKKKIEADYKPPSDKEIERFGAHQEFLDKNNGLIEDLGVLKDYISKNPDAAGWMDRFKTLGTSAADGSGMFTPEMKQKLAEKGLLATPEQQDFFGRMERIQQRLIAQEQLRQKGVQTEGDALRYGKANFDSLSKLSGQALSNAIDDRLKDAYKDQSRVYGNFEGIAKRYQPGGDPRFQPDATGIDKWRETADVAKSRLSDLEKSIQDRRTQQSQQPQQGQGGNPGNGGNRPDPASLAPSLFGGNRAPSGPTPNPPSAPPAAPPPPRASQYGVQPRAARIGDTDVFLMPDGSARTLTGTLIPKEQVEKARGAGLIQ